MRRVNRGLSSLMSLLLCISSLSFSMIVNAEETNTARIIGFGPLEENIASQTLPVGASIDDVILPGSLKAVVETEEVAENKDAEEEKAQEEAVEEIASDTEESTKPTEKTESTETPAPSEDFESTEAPKTDSDGSEASSDEATPVDEEHTNSADNYAAEATENEIVDTGNVEIQSLSMVGKTSEITIENVTWKIADGKEFDSTKETTYTFEPVFSTDYVVAATAPTIIVNIINTNNAKANLVNVTFKVVGGSWDDGFTTDKTVTLNKGLKLTADQIPAVGTKPSDKTYRTGSWDTTPSIESSITESITYTYTYAAKKAAVVIKAPEAKKLIYVGETK